MPAVARVSDRTQGVCSHPSHDNPIGVGGTITTGSSSVSIDGLAMAIQGSTVVTDCGHTSYVITSSSTASHSMGAARVGDSVGGGPYSATITTGSPTTSNG